MPIYEYQCQSCEHEFETLQKMSDPLLTDCPACHEQALRKKVSAAAFRLKGGGWYETDFKTGQKRNVAGEGSAEGAAKQAEAKNGSDKSDSKPAKEGKSGGSKGGDSKSETKSSTAPKTASPTATSAS